MNVSDRDRKTIIVGAAAAVVIVSVFYVLLPLKRRWSEAGDDLAPMLEQVEDLRDRVEGRDSLLARRNILVRRLGSLLGPDPSAETEKPDKPGEPARDSSEAEKNKEEQTPGKPEKPSQDEEEAKSDDKKEKVGENGEEDPTDQTDRTDEPEKANEPEKADEAEKTDEPDEAWSGVPLAAQLERLASKSGVKIKRISPKKVPGTTRGRKHFTRVMMQVSFECNIETLIKMLHALEKGDRFMRVERLQLTRNLSKGETIDVSLDVLAYEAATGQP